MERGEGKGQILFIVGIWRVRMLYIVLSYVVYGDGDCFLRGGWLDDWKDNF